MEPSQWLADRFEENRGHLRGVAYRILGSLPEADDAVQESWLRLSRTGADGVDNLSGWLTTVVARICLDMIRARNARREEELDDRQSVPAAPQAVKRADPEGEAILADSVGLALLVVLDRLAPPERLAFVLHDMFDLPFEEISSILGRSPGAVRQLASRARRRVRGGAPSRSASIPEQRRLIEAFLSALRAGDVNALVAVLDPEIAVEVDQPGAAHEDLVKERRAEFWARKAISLAQGAKAARVALVDGQVGIVVAPRGHLVRVLRFTITHGRIAGLEVVSDKTRLAAMDLGVLEV
jgi:RNA polymerase sigma-70 factor, ECF subfamily